MAKRTKRIAQGTATNAVRIPITNVYCGSDYTAQILIGSEQTPANVIMDTGSSTLAVKPSVYNAAKDTNMVTSTLAQEVLYGTGGWAGPVISTSLVMGEGSTAVTLKAAPIAITSIQQPGNFGANVDGILGLAYNALNNAYNFSAYLIKNKIKPAATYPWIFPGKNFKTFTTQFQKVIKSQAIPEVDVVPYFTELEQNGVTADKFAFYTLRSWVKQNSSAKNMAKDPMNNGYFILGGGEEQTDLYTGDFMNVAVLHDLYYNTNLKAIQVDGCEPVAAQPLQQQYRPYAISNSIIDSGTSDLSLAQDVYQAILSSLQKLNPKFIKLIDQSNKLNSENKAISAASLNLASWPGISFILTGDQGQDVKLTCTPQTYWQTDFPAVGDAMFQISGPVETGLNQSILGLPLMNNYYSVFDRSLDSYGIIRFAPIVQP